MRTKLVDGVRRNFTPAEETARDIEEAQWAAEQVKVIIEQTFTTESEAARGSLTDAEINSYEGMWAEVQARHSDPSAPTDQIQAFATEMGITPADAVTLIRDKLRPYKLGISTALAKREKALIALP